MPGIPVPLIPHARRVEKSGIGIQEQIAEGSLFAAVIQAGTGEQTHVGLGRFFVLVTTAGEGVLDMEGSGDWTTKIFRTGVGILGFEAEGHLWFIAPDAEAFLIPYFAEAEPEYEGIVEKIREAGFEVELLATGTLLTMDKGTATELHYVHEDVEVV